MKDPHRRVIDITRAFVFAILLGGIATTVHAECTCPDCFSPSFCANCYCYTPLPLDPI